MSVPNDVEDKFACRYFVFVDEHYRISRETNGIHNHTILGCNLRFAF